MVTYVFDINETLLDLAALDGLFGRLTGTDGARSEWFDLVIHTALTTTATGAYRNFSVIGAECAQAVCTRHRRPFTDDDRAALGAAMRSLPPHPDVPAALGRLRDTGAALVAFGNSPLPVIRDQLGNAGIADFFDGAYSADQAQALKPAPGAYRWLAGTLGVEPAELTMVAVHDWDIAGAHAAGLDTVFLTRDRYRPLPGYPAPTLVARDLAGAVERR